MENDEITQGETGNSSVKQNVFKRKGGGGERTELNLSQEPSGFSEGLSEAFEKLLELTVSVDEAPSSGKALSHDGTCSSQCKTTHTT